MNPIIGVCGGIGSGKSHVALLFEPLGCAVFNADQEAHNCLSGEQEVIEQIQQKLGYECYPTMSFGWPQPDRKKIAEIVFNSPEKLKILESIVVPQIIDRCLHFICKYRSKHPIILDVPLLFERNIHGLCDAIVFVAASFETRCKRVAARGWSKQYLELREAHQILPVVKQQLSDYIIDNDEGGPDLAGQVSKILYKIWEKCP